jgi:hypothetical protein
MMKRLFSPSLALTNIRAVTRRINSMPTVHKGIPVEKEMPKYPRSDRGKGIAKQPIAPIKLIITAAVNAHAEMTSRRPKGTADSSIVFVHTRMMQGIPTAMEANMTKSAGKNSIPDSTRSLHISPGQKFGGRKTLPLTMNAHPCAATVCKHEP